MHIVEEVHKHLYYSALLGLVAGLVLGIVVLGVARIGGGQPAKTVTVTLPVPTTVTRTITRTVNVQGGAATVTKTVTATVNQAAAGHPTPPGKMRLTYESGGSLIDIVYSSGAGKVIRVHVGVRVLIEGIGALYNATLSIGLREVNVTIILSLPQIPLVSIPTLYNVTIYLMHGNIIVGVAHGRMRLLTNGQVEKTILPIEWFIGKPDLGAITNVEIKLKPIR